MNKEIKTDISVVGAGVTGLMLTKKLTDLGYKVALVEQQGIVGNGPSTKNEGWLHRGTYHATSIQDEAQAMQVANRCIYGHEQIRSFAPEAIEDLDRATYAVVSNDETAQKATDRWEKAGILYRPVPLGKFVQANPEVNITKITDAFQVGDLSINTRILYQKLLTQSEKGGAKIFLKSKFIPEDGEKATLDQGNGDKINLHSDLFIVTAGYGIKDTFRQVTGQDLPVRYWKSHLLVFPRLTKSNIFSINPGEAALFNHGSKSVVGQHEDAVTVSNPNLDIIPDRAVCVFDATQRLIPSANQHEKAYMAIACIKPDVVQSVEQARTLDISVFSPVENYIFALPGKMTEAPFVADQIVQMVFNRNSETTARVAFRPCDTYELI